MAADRPSSTQKSATATAAPRSAIYDYLSAVVHDLRNPLGAAVGNLSFVRDGLAPDQDDLGEAIDDAADAIRRVEALVDELVSVAQFEAGALRLRPEPVDLAPLVTAAAEGAQREAALRSVTVRAIAQQPVSIDADANLVRRVIESLLWCGFRATPARGLIELRASHVGATSGSAGSSGSAATSGADGAGVLTVACTGALDAATGAAPAVYFARSIISAHGGTLDVTSEPDFATVIRLSWP